MTKSRPSTEEAIEIFNNNPFSPEFKELVRSGQWDEIVEAKRRENALKMTKKRFPDLTDEEARKIEEKYPYYSSKDEDWPIALVQWVEHQCKNKKKFTERKRSYLLRIAGYIRENFQPDRYVFDSEDVSRLMMAAYFIGVHCPSPYETWPKISEARKKTKGRKPKWRAVADKVMTELAAKKSSVISATTHKTTRINILHPRLNERLTELGMKPVSPSSVRDYLTRFDKERT